MDTPNKDLKKVIVFDAVSGEYSILYEPAADFPFEEIRAIDTSSFNDKS